MRKQRLHEFVWVGGCDTAPVGEPQVRASWHHGGHGAVDVVGPVAPPGRANGRGWGTQECTQIGESSLLEPFWGICVHCCDASCVEWYERLNHYGVSAAPPSVTTSRLVGKPGSARAAPSRGWHLPEILTHKPPKSQKNSLVPPNKTVRLAGEMSRT